jgi:hypothetical protein
MRVQYQCRKTTAQSVYSPSHEGIPDQNHTHTMTPKWMPDNSGVTKEKGYVRLTIARSDFCLDRQRVGDSTPLVLFQDTLRCYPQLPPSSPSSSTIYEFKKNDALFAWWGDLRVSIFDSDFFLEFRDNDALLLGACGFQSSTVTS